MTGVADKPVIYEINTAVWLNGLSAQLGRPVTLASVPDAVVDALATPGVTMIWLMGVWERSDYSRRHALIYKHEYTGALPDLTDADVIGSAYSIRAYEVAESFGGRAALAVFREQLRARGLGLMLDYVPNHVGPDHAWVEEPGFVIRGKAADADLRPSDFFRHKLASGKTVVLAHGRDPYFPGWADTAQLNAFSPALRAEVIRTLLDIADQCDGVRCDMAMLFLNEIFASTWAGYVKQKPKKEFWAEVIPAVRAAHPAFLFLAEVYWGREGDLLALGFDSVYDKTFYDRLIASDARSLHAHLLAPRAFQHHAMRFIENHDEPRAWTAFGPQRVYPALTVLLTLPGGVLLHDGQFTGRRAKLPVQITRAPVEIEHLALRDYTLRLLRETTDPVYHAGEFVVFDVQAGGPHDATWAALLAYGCHLQDDGYRLIVVNLGGQHAYGRVDLAPWLGISGRSWRLFDVIDGAEYVRRGDELSQAGLYVSLEAYEAHVFRFELLEI